MESDEIYKQGKAVLRVAHATEVRGLLFELLLDDSAKKHQARKGCVALLKQADLHCLEMPAAFEGACGHVCQDGLVKV